MKSHILRFQLFLQHFHSVFLFNHSFFHFFIEKWPSRHSPNPQLLIEISYIEISIIFATVMCGRVSGKTLHSDNHTGVGDIRETVGHKNTATRRTRGCSYVGKTHIPRRHVQRVSGLALAFYFFLFPSLSVSGMLICSPSLSSDSCCRMYSTIRLVFFPVVST